MNFSVLTLFPEIINSYCSSSIVARAVSEGLISVDAVDIRDFANNKHNRVDDYVYGGGEGMLMQAEPVYLSYQSIKDNLEDNHRVIYTSPCGRRFDSSYAKELSWEKDIVILCGHYEGIDQRVLDEIVTDYVSIGDYVMTGGELAALVILDSTVRFVDGVLGNEDSAANDSFSNGLLEHPQYTRPFEWRGKKVPEVLISGHHAMVDEWCRKQSLANTLKYRPDLLNDACLSENDKKLLADIKSKL